MRHARPDYERFQDPAGLIPEDEPVFILRGQDRAAPDAVRFWALHAFEMGASRAIVSAACQQAFAMEMWQIGHQRKVPDLPKQEEPVPDDKMIPAPTYSDLATQVQQYRTFQLPGQPNVTHMGTAYLIDKLWQKVQELRMLLSQATGQPPVD